MPMAFIFKVLAVVVELRVFSFMPVAVSASAGVAVGLALGGSGGDGGKGGVVNVGNNFVIDKTYQVHQQRSVVSQAPSPLKGIFTWFACPKCGRWCGTGGLSVAGAGALGAVGAVTGTASVGGQGE